jgi:teichuronic acid biosynthesis glycosyltransferase TuaH
MRSFDRGSFMDQDWTGMVVLHAATHWDGVKLADQHLAEALSRIAPVLYVDPPMSVLSPLKRPERRQALREPRLRLLGPGLARLTPVVQPGMERPGLVGLTTYLTRQAMRRATRMLGGRVQAVICVSTLVRTLGACGEVVQAYWLQDDFVGGAALFGLNPERIRKGEFALAAQADVLIASSPSVAETWRSRGYDPVLIPHGSAPDAFAGTDAAPLPGDVDLPAPIAGFIGHINDRVDVGLLEAVADTGSSLLLVGPRHEKDNLGRMERLLARDNVAWVGPKPFETLPSYYRAMDVCLVPYGDSAYNRGSFPLKILEYLSAGRGVVASDLPATRWLLDAGGGLGGAEGLIAIAADAPAFAEAVKRALAARRSALHADRCRTFAAAHSWDVRARAFAAALGLAGAAAEAGANGTGGHVPGNPSGWSG